MRSDVVRLLEVQSGVIARRQVIEAGETDNDIERRVRRREWKRMGTGVFINHTGTPSWEQRAWAAVHRHWPAALSGAGALRAHNVRPWHQRVADDAPIEVLVDASRRIASTAGIVIRRSRTFDAVTQLRLSPPRVRIEHAVLDLAACSTDPVARVATLADACQSRRTTATRLAEALRDRPRLPGRADMLTLLDDVALGACSVLEHRYLREVERAHALPAGVRQRRLAVAGAPIAYRDVEYDAHATVVELDGRLGHEFTEDRWADLDRDMASAARGEVTVRLGWRQVLEPCRVARALGRILQARGWQGAPAVCGPDCAVTLDRGVHPPPGAGRTPRSA